jgi:hypothetical protein
MGHEKRGSPSVQTISDRQASRSPGQMSKLATADGPGGRSVFRGGGRVCFSSYIPKWAPEAVAPEQGMPALTQEQMDGPAPTNGATSTTPPFHISPISPRLGSPWTGTRFQFFRVMNPDTNPLVHQTTEDQGGPTNGNPGGAGSARAVGGARARADRYTPLLCRRCMCGGTWACCDATAFDRNLLSSTLARSLCSR